MNELQGAGADLLAATQDLELSIRDGLSATVEGAVSRRNAAFTRFVQACEGARIDVQGGKARDVARRVLALDTRILELLALARDAIREEVEGVASLRRAQQKGRGSGEAARFISRRV